MIMMDDGDYDGYNNEDDNYNNIITTKIIINADFRKKKLRHFTSHRHSLQKLENILVHD